MVGKKLSHYLIEAELGRGGMGIVYKAEDTKLDRTVAIKVLPSAALASEDDRARFYREAKAAAQLHHPHIASVFEIDEAVPEGSKDDDLRPFIAMEYIEGETLHDRIQKGPLKLEEAVRIASQIASGLKAAHAKDIVHRDIKGGNIMLTSEGEAKILDFGLAQTAASTKLTRMGSTLGTVAYMSPEQAQGSTVDRRTDIWSLGVILYEMISGQSPFPGEYDKAVIYSILNQEAEPLTALRTGVPMELERITAKCIAKEAKARYQSATDLIVDLENVDVVSSRMSRMPGAISAADPARAQVAIASDTGEQSLVTAAKKAWPLIAVAVVVTAALGYLAFSENSIPLKTSRYSKLLFPDETNSLIWGFHRFDTSPDGRYIAFQGGDLNQSRIYIQEWNERAARAITPETDVAHEPFFSPDSRELGYFDVNTGELKRIALPDGSPQIIATVAGLCCNGITWGPNDRIVYSLVNSGLLEQSLDGGQPKILTTLDSLNNERTHRLPHFIEGTNDLLFTIGKTTDKSWDDAQIGMYSNQSRTYRVLLSGGRDARYVPTGHIVYGESGSLVATTFDLKTARVGNPVRLVDGIGVSEVFSRVDYTFDRSGRLVYLDGSREDENTRLVWYNRSGKFIAVEDSSAIFRKAIISRATDQILLWMGGSNDQVWIRDRTTGTNEPFTRSANNFSPRWSPNGDSIAFVSSAQGGGLFIEPVDRSAPAEQILSTKGFIVDLFWSSSGKNIAFTERGQDGLFFVRILNVNSGTIRTLAEERSNTMKAQISPDEKWIAYQSDEVGHHEVYIRRLDDLSDKRRISIGGGSQPVWNSNGIELFYTSNNSLVSASLSTNGTSEVERRVLFELSSLTRPGETTSKLITGYDYDSETKQFLFVIQKNIDPVSRVEVVVNWFEELNRLVPISN